MVLSSAQYAAKQKDDTQNDLLVLFKRKIMAHHSVSLELNGREYSIETGRFAKLATARHFALLRRETHLVFRIDWRFAVRQAPVFRR